MIKAYSDGACRGNPGPSSCAYVIYNDRKEEIDVGARELGIKTNNDAEYEGLLDALHALDSLNIKNADIYCDSALVVNQVNGVWNISPKFRDRQAHAYLFLVRGGHTLIHVDGHSGIKGNERADQLCNNVLDAVKLGNGYWKDGIDRS
jgi:ribonuclease HI